MATEVTVRVQPPYQVRIGSGVCSDVSFLAAGGWAGERLVVVTDSRVRQIYGEQFFGMLAQYEPLVLEFPAGEESKSRETKQQMEDAMLRAGVNRDTCILAFGGGVVSDLAGFLASTYCRGVQALYVPTTLLAMVDASVGGKTGVNTPYGKNMIGTFYQPCGVFMDTDFLLSLSGPELLNGFAEMLKHALLSDRDAFFQLAEQVKAQAGDKGLLQDKMWLEQALAQSVSIKKSFVERDECDKTVRQALNLGHTLGHAVENLSGYAVAHGYAVAIGIFIEAYLAAEQGELPYQALQAIQHCLEGCGYPLWTPCLEDEDRVMDVLRLDKKATSSDVRVVLLQDIGQLAQEAVQAVPAGTIRSALQWYNSRCWA